MIYVLFFSICEVGDLLYPEVTSSTLNWWFKKISLKMSLSSVDSSVLSKNIVYFI